MEVRHARRAIGCMGHQKEVAAANCYAALPDSDSKVIYVMGQDRHRGVAVKAPLWSTATAASNNDFGLTGTRK